LHGFSERSANPKVVTTPSKKTLYSRVPPVFPSPKVLKVGVIIDARTVILDMKKDRSLELKRVGIFLLVALLSTPFLNVFLTQVNAQETGVKVEPPTQEIGADGVLLPTPPYTVTISVTNVVDLFTWQIRLYFNSAILRFDEAWLPEGHVFDDKMTVPVAPVEGSDENGTYIDYGCSLILVNDAFTGSGILCQINFTGFAPGSSALSFSETGPGRDTFLLDSYSQDMDFDVTGGSIMVKGITVAKEDSEITLALSSEDVAVGGDVTISGAITPVQGIVNVTIKYKKSGEVSWSSLMNVPTDSESQYTYTWTTTEKGTYDIKASWSGDADTWPDESTPKTLRVGVEGAIEIVTYVIVGVVAVVVILAIVLYFVKFRKPE